MSRDLEDFERFWSGGRRDAVKFRVAGHTVAVTGGWPAEDDFPTQFAATMNRLIGSGSLRVAGFADDG